MLKVPFETIASATSDHDGHVKFENLLEDDGAGATSRDGQFHGEVQLKAGTSEYEIRLNKHGGISVEYARGITESGYFDSGSKAAKTLVTILDHYVATDSGEFLSLAGYVIPSRIIHATVVRFRRWVKSLKVNGRRSDQNAQLFDF